MVQEAADSGVRPVLLRCTPLGRNQAAAFASPGISDRRLPHSFRGRCNSRNREDSVFHSDRDLCDLSFVSPLRGAGHSLTTGFGSTPDDIDRQFQEVRYLRLQGTRLGCGRAGAAVPAGRHLADNPIRRRRRPSVRGTGAPRQKEQPPTDMESSLIPRTPKPPPDTGRIVLSAGYEAARANGWWWELT